MKRLPPYWAAVLALTTTLTGLSPRNVHAGCCDHVTALEEDNQSALILEARVTGRICLKLENGSIVTDVTIQPIETFKGINQSEDLIVRIPGGQIGNEAQHDSGTVQLITDQDYLLRLTWHQNSWKCLNARVERASKGSEKRRNGYRAIRKQKGKKSQRLTLISDSLSSTETSADLPAKPPNPDPEPDPIPEVPASGYMENDQGIPSRFAVCDSGATIHYLVDTDILPSGISQSQALQAVEDALAVWSNASGLIFQYDGNVSFGQAAKYVDKNDYKLRIQLHNKYNLFDNNSSTLGEGGGWRTFPTYFDEESNEQPLFPDGGSGGRVKNQEFHLRTRGYLSLNHVSSTMQNLSTFTEVLTHELGHALGLDHSSEDPNETTSTLSDAMMYYRVHADGRGASLGIYDHEKIDFGYPAANMPPSGMNRVMYSVTGTPQPTGLGVDRITISGSDRESPESINVEVINSSATSINGSFTTEGSALIIYTPNAAYSGALTEEKIENGNYNDKVSFSISDGTNLSARHDLRVIGYKYDSTPSDGLPDSWMTTHFGTTSVGAVGDDNHPDSDPDGDGMSNRIEFIYGTDPNDPASYPPLMSYDHEAQTVSWNTINRMPYYLECSDDMSAWINLGAFLGNGTRLTSDVTNSSNTQRFYRIKLQP